MQDSPIMHVYIGLIKCNMSNVMRIYYRRVYGLIWLDCGFVEF